MKKILISLLLTSIVIISEAQTKLFKSVTLTVDSSVTANQQAITGFVRKTQTTPMPSIDTTSWHYVVMTKSANNTGGIYIDGKLAQQLEYTSEPFNWTKLYLGTSYYTSFSRFYSGIVDELRVSKIARTDSEILNYYNSNSTFSSDANTIGLFHFDETSGATFSNSVGTSGVLYNQPKFVAGKFSNGLLLDGVSNYGDCKIDMPESQFTIELWVKLNGHQTSSIFNMYGMYNIDFGFQYNVGVKPTYTWSTGAKGYTTTVDPTTVHSVWVNNGTITDTINLTGLCVNPVTVTDTLKISAITGINSLPPSFGEVKVFPNPAHDILNISVSNPTNYYTIQITNNLGTVVYSASLNSASTQINLGSLGAKGLYFIKILDISKVLDTRKLIIE